MQPRKLKPGMQSYFDPTKRNMKKKKLKKRVKKRVKTNNSSNMPRKLSYSIQALFNST